MANTVIGALSVEISVDSKGVEDGIKASGEALAIGGKQLRESANKWGKWAVAAIAATTAVTAAIVKTNLDGIRELKATAAAADETVEAFQRGAFAAEQFGISQEKYGDILKDVNDRVGDFLITGAGPMVDFFETIGPKVDITAESFKGLSGSQSLGLYVSSLQKAGASQQEMTFFMEALAGDATRLIPLFENNAEALNTLTAEAKALGIGLSDIDVTKAEMASQALAKSLAVTKSFGQELTVELAPIIGSVIDLFEDMAKEAGGASQFIKQGISGVVDVVGVFADGLQGTIIIFKTLEIAALGFSALAVNVFNVVTQVIATSVDGWIMIVNEGIKGINSAFDTGLKPISLATDSSFVSGLSETADAMISVVAKANGELDKLMMQPLNSDSIKNFVDASVVEYERLAKAKVEIDSKNKEEKDAAAGVGTNESSVITAFIDETSAMLELMGLRFQSQEELELASLDRKQAMLDASLKAKKIAEADYNKQSADIEQAGVEARRKIVENSLRGGIEFLARNSKKAQKLLRAAAIVNAVISGQEAAVHSFNAGAKIGGPVVGAAFAALSIANTAGMIMKIKSSGSSSSGSGSGSVGGSLPITAPTSGSASNSSANIPESRNISINLTGGGLMSTDQVRELIGQINEQTGDGVQLITNGV